MDKRTIIGFIIVGLIIILYPLYMEWITGGKSVQEVPVKPQAEVDTLTQVPPPRQETKEIPPPEAESNALSLTQEDTLVEEKMVRVETELYSAEFSTRGGVLKSFILKKYQDPDGRNIQLLPSDPQDPNSDQTHPPLNLIFPDSKISFEGLNFQVDRDQVNLDERNTTGTINFTLTTQSGVQITKRYNFFNGGYDFEMEFEIRGLGQLDMGRKYLLGWAPGLNSTEENRKEDLGYFSAYSMMGTELSEIKKFHKSEVADFEVLQEAGSGETRWVATRTKYFVAAIVPLSRKGMGFSASGRRSFTFIRDEQIENKRIGVFLEMPVERTGTLKDRFMVYVGPIDYHILKSYRVDLDRMVNLGWKIIRPFSIAILWIFVNLHKIISNYGLVIILFTILMKGAFHPLTRKSTKATLKMAELQPKMAQLKEKFKKDPARLNKETMKLYKQSGVNPLGGCLPLLFQMPVFYGLFVVFRSTIELRGAEFILWLTDLSQKDPYYVLPIIMAGTMFWQQKITIKDPKQAMLVYFMPILFFFFFYSFPAGLTLYWTAFNVLSLIETYYFKRKGLHPSAVAPQPASVKGR
ncbi:MAG: membrane protein insertase YidC [candidate division Zixibacteria bacterium]|nr:membrane protein insertase YidC [candidate division Zixibacteria bacterium]